MRASRPSHGGAGERPLRPAGRAAGQLDRRARAGATRGALPARGLPSTLAAGDRDGGRHVLLVGVAAQGVYPPSTPTGSGDPKSSELGQAVVQSRIFIAFVVGLGRALLSNGRPSWRLPPIPDATAKRLAPFPWLTAVVAALVWAPAQVNAVVEASFAAVVATHVATALALTALIGAMLLRLHGPRAAPDASPGDGHAQGRGAPAAAAVPAAVDRPIWIGFLLGAVALLVIVIWVLVGTGYVAMASFLASQLTWSGCVVAPLRAVQAGRRPVHGAGVVAQQLRPAAAEELRLCIAHAGPGGGGAVGPQSRRAVLLHADLAGHAAGHQPRRGVPAQRQVRHRLQGRRIRTRARRDLQRHRGAGRRLRHLARAQEMAGDELPSGNGARARHAELDHDPARLCGRHPGGCVLALGAGHRHRAHRLGGERAVGRHRLRVAGHRAELHLGADPAGGTAGQGRRLGGAGQRRRRRAAHQRARHRDPAGRPLHADRAEFGVHHQDECAT